ncbi:astacin-like metalloendopeptidase [Ctenodactylus gundi]
MGGLWPWVLGLLSLPVVILGAPLASRCSGACSTSVPEGLAPEGTQVSWDKDIPAINQGLIPSESPDGSFLVEGDIIRPSLFRMLSVTNNKWPKSAGGVVEVPFLLSSKYDEPSRQVILEALAEFERFTCIRFVAYQGQRDFVSIMPMSGCFSGVGRSGGMQVVSLAPACLRRGRGIVLHELMHVLGFWHEHARADRDRYIRVNWNEIRPGFEINFVKSQSSNMLVPYDYSSVMHYGRLAFSRRGQPTIIPLWTPGVHIGQRWNLSASDITRIRRLYDCSPSGPESRERGSQVHSSGRSPTPVSRLYLQRLLEAVGPWNPVPSGPGTGGQSVPAGPREAPHRQEAPASKKFSVEFLARPPQTLASSSRSRPGAGAAGSFPPTSLAEAALRPRRSGCGTRGDPRSAGARHPAPRPGSAGPTEPPRRAGQGLRPTPPPQFLRWVRRRGGGTSSCPPPRPARSASQSAGKWPASVATGAQPCVAAVPPASPSSCARIPFKQWLRRPWARGGRGKGLPRRVAERPFHPASPAPASRPPPARPPSPPSPSLLPTPPPHASSPLLPCPFRGGLPAGAAPGDSRDPSERLGSAPPWDSPRTPARRRERENLENFSGQTAGPPAAVGKDVGGQWRA